MASSGPAAANARIAANPRIVEPARRGTVRDELRASDKCKDALTDRGCKASHDSMARHSGGPVTHRALTGPRRTGASLSSEEAWKDEVLPTLTSIQEIRQRCDRTELRTVQEARKAGLSWTEIATALGVTR
jgi:hypothetical protein